MSEGNGFGYVRNEIMGHLEQSLKYKITENLESAWKVFGKGNNYYD